MTSSLVRGRYVVVAANRDGSVRWIRDGAVFQRDGEIVEVGPYAELKARHNADEELGSDRDVVLPGLINAHHHVGLTPFQLGTLDLPLETWIPARTAARRVDARLDTLYAAVKMIESGITTVMHNGRPGRYEVDGSSPVLDAWRQSGMRVAFSIFYRDQNRYVYEDDERFLATLPEDLRATAVEMRPPDMAHDEYFELFERLYHRYGQNADPRIRILLSPGNVQWCSDAFLTRVKEYAGRYSTGIHIHVQETRYQKEYGIRTWGKTPAAHLQDLGFLGPEVSCAHGVWLTDDDLGLLADASTTICTNPSSNLRLKSGVAPVTRMLERGVPVAIGIDEAGINDDNDILQEMRLAAKLHREPGVGGRSLSSGEVMHMATRAGAIATGFGNPIGTLEASKRADLVLLDLDRITEPFLDPSIDIVDAVLYRGRGLDVHTVMVDGDVLYRDGHHTTIDRDALLAEIREAMGGELTAEERARRERIARLTERIHAYFAEWRPGAGEPYYLTNERT